MFMNYQMVKTISVPADSTGTWSLDGQLIPNPLSFGAAEYTHSGGTDMVEFVNAQIDPANTHAARLNAFLTQFKRWRLAYASVTIYQDGPDLANQGTVCVAQKPVTPTRFNIYETESAAVQPGALGMHHAFHMDASDKPNYTASQAMPNAYFGKSKEGAYIPLKLTRTHQQWQSARDLTYQANSATLVAYSNSDYGGRIYPPTSDKTDGTGVYPFLSVNDLHLYSRGALGATKDFVGSLTSDFCNDNWADFSFRNLAVTTSLSFFFRFGFEMQVQPESILSPHLKLSPESDPLAVETYFAISRELKDAYPADYNDWGKIWDVISSVAKSISPALNMVPVAGPLLSRIVPTVAEAGDSLRAALKRTKTPSSGSVASEADLEKARAMVPVAPPLPQFKAQGYKKRVVGRDRSAAIAALEARIAANRAALVGSRKRLSVTRRS